MTKDLFTYIDLDCLVKINLKKGSVKGRIIKYEERGLILKISQYKSVFIEYDKVIKVEVIRVSCNSFPKRYKSKDITIGLRDYYVERLGGSKKVRKMVQEWIMKEAMGVNN